MSITKLTGSSNLLKKSKSGINQRELSLAMAEATECGAGLNPIKGYIILPNFNSSSGDKEGYYGLYIADGELVIDTAENVKAQIEAFCNNSLVSATGASISGCVVSSLVEGNTRQLTASVTPSNALQTGTWTTSNASIATVNASGLVTGVGAGTATITFTSTDGGFTATCSVVVIAD